MKQFLPRLIAFFFDWSLALWPFHLLISIPRMEVYQRKLDRFFLNNLESLGWEDHIIELISCVFMLFFISQIIRGYTTFFLGKTFGQILMRQKEEKSFWWKRLSGSFRIFLETILAPFGFTYLFLFFKGKTLHDLLSDSNLVFSNKRKQIILVPFTIALSLISMATSPIALNYSDFHDFQYEQEIVRPNKLNEDIDFSQFEELGSLTFGFSVFSSLEHSQLFYFPSLEIKKEGKRLLKTPIVYIIDKKTGAIGKLTIEIKFQIEHLIETAQYANPLMNHSFPTLLEKPMDISSTAVTEEFIQLIDDVFGLSLKSTPSLIFKIGPVLLGPAKFRKRILKFLSNTASVQVQRVTLNNDRFLRLQQLFDKTEFDEFPFQETFIGLENLNGKVVQIKWGRDKQSAQAREKFEKHFLSTISLTEQPWSERRFPEGDWSTFDVIDGIMKKTMIDQDKVHLRLQVIKKIDELNQINKTLKSNKIQKIILQAINRFLFLQNSKSSHLKSPAFRNQLITIKDEMIHD